MTDQVTAPTVFTTEPATTVTPVVAQPDITIPTTIVPDQGHELVGEGKKYADVNAALAALPHAQSHIATLEADNARLREESIKAKSIEDVLNQMNANQPAVSDPIQEPVDQAAIATQVLNTLKAQEAESKTTNNILDADAAVRQAYGDKAGEVTQAAAAKLGMSLVMMQEIAGQSPTAFLKLLADNTNSISDVPLHVPTSVNAQAVVEHSPTDQLKKPDHSVLSGASSSQVLDEWRRCKTLAENDMNS